MEGSSESESSSSSSSSESSDSEEFDVEAHYQDMQSEYNKHSSEVDALFDKWQLNRME